MITETVGEDWADVLFLKEQRADELRNLLPEERCAGERRGLEPGSARPRSSGNGRPLGRGVGLNPIPPEPILG